MAQALEIAVLLTQVHTRGQDLEVAANVRVAVALLDQLLAQHEHPALEVRLRGALCQEEAGELHQIEEELRASAMDSNLVCPNHSKTSGGFI